MIPKFIDAILVGVGSGMIGYHFGSQWVAIGVSIICFAVIDFRRYEHRVDKKSTSEPYRDTFKLSFRDRVKLYNENPSAYKKMIGK